MADELAELLAQGERAAFHGPPASGLEPLQRALVVGQAAGRDAEAAAAAWLLGVCLSAAGRLGPSLKVLEPLISSAGGETTPEHRLVASLAASTTASVHRQLGRHSVARAYDEQAWNLSGGAEEPAFDALVGMASDSIGLGDVEAAVSAADRAEELADPRTDWWRQRVRLDWARAELALLNGSADEAAIRASSGLSRAEASGAPRHVAKSLLLLSIALLERGDIDEATATLRRAAMLAEGLGTLNVLWPARALLGALLVDTDTDGSIAALEGARAAVNAIGAELPDGLKAEWFARDDVAALLS